MNSTIIILILVIPILIIIVSILIYNYFIEFNKQKKIIRELSKDQHEILEEKKEKINFFSKEEKNWLGKKTCLCRF